MARKDIHIIILMLSVFVLMGFGSNALAHMQQGFGYNRGWHHGSGMHHYGYDFQGDGGYWENMSESEIEQMRAERKAFFDATREIRQQVYQKSLELRSELAKKEPGSDKSKRLQKEIAELQAQIGLERLNHILKIKKINPDIGRGSMGHGWGSCGMMAPGHHMNPGMMGPGMMGPGHHMRPGGYGEDDTRQYHMMQSSPTE